MNSEYLAKPVNIEIKADYDYHIFLQEATNGSIKLSVCLNFIRIFIRNLSAGQDLYLSLKSTKRLRKFLDKAIKEMERRKFN